MSDDDLESTRASWNVATRAHNAHKRDQAAFLRAGGSTLYPEEKALLGDVKGKDVLHLCCNSGQDTLSIGAGGARVVGVDLGRSRALRAAALYAPTPAPSGSVAFAFTSRLSTASKWVKGSSNQALRIFTMRAAWVPSRMR